MIPKSRGEDVRPVTLVGYEEGPHPLISGKAVEKQLAIYSCDKVAVVSYIVMLQCGQLPIMSNLS